MSRKDITPAEAEQIAEGIVEYCSMLGVACVVFVHGQSGGEYGTMAMNVEVEGAKSILRESLNQLSKEQLKDCPTPPLH